MQPLSDQIVAFLLLIVLGVFLGFLFDCYRLIRRLLQPKARGTILGDALFCLLITVITYCFLLFFTWGEVRLYVFLALLCGTILYLKLFSKRVLSFLVRTYSLVRKILVKLVGILLTPIKIIWLIISFPFRFLKFMILSFFYGGHRILLIFTLPIRHWGRKPPPDQNC